MAERKLDIFQTLKQADLKNVEYYEKLTEEEQKGFLPFLVMRWLSGTYSARQVYFLNELVNPIAFSLTKHKQLLWQLFTVCTSGKSQRYVWNKLPSKANSSKPISTKIVSEYCQCSLKDAADALKCLTGNDVLDIAETLGTQSDDIAKIRKEYKGEKLRKDSIGSSKTPSKTKINQKTPENDFFNF